ncbi:MAG TPA: hypothetical protein VGS19_21670 [Streptosporangiaceae bacterium]|nr:hypothetical protein [Streptosporangiaceae bacterium]
MATYTDSPTPPQAKALEPPRLVATRRRQVQVTRRPRRREEYSDTTLTDTWPPRLNTAL